MDITDDQIVLDLIAHLTRIAQFGFTTDDLLRGISRLKQAGVEWP